MLGSGYATRQAPKPGGEKTQPGAAAVREKGVQSEPRHPQDVLLEHYPELATQPETNRGGLIMPKVISRNVVGIFEGIALGMVLTLVTSVPLAMGGTLLAGHLVRRWGGPRAALVPYLEAYAAVTVGWFDVIVIALALAGILSLPPMGVTVWVLTVLALACPLAGVLRGWRWQDRWRMYAAAAAVVLLVYAVETESGFRWVVFIAFTPAAVLLVGRSLRRSPPDAPAPPSDVPPSGGAETLTAAG
jgi:hypothetical protein